MQGLDGLLCRGQERLQLQWRQKRRSAGGIVKTRWPRRDQTAEDELLVSGDCGVRPVKGDGGGGVWGLLGESRD